MALTTKLPVAVRNARCTDLATRCNSGYIRIYSGTQPSDPDQAPSGTLLAELRFGATAFGAPSGGSMSANPITPDASANASGTAAWARILQSDGATPVMDVSVGESGCNINLNSTSIVIGGQVSISAWTHTEPLTEGT